VANYVVMVRFDEETDKKILRLQEKLIANGYQNAMNSWPPHITIAAYEGVDEQSYSMKRFLVKQKSQLWKSTLTLCA